MMDKQCPWCGENSDESMSYDAWLEAHVTDCQPYLKETYADIIPGA